MQQLDWSFWSLSNLRIREFRFSAGLIIWLCIRLRGKRLYKNQYVRGHGLCEKHIGPFSWKCDTLLPFRCYTISIKFTVLTGYNDIHWVRQFLRSNRRYKFASVLGAVAVVEAADHERGVVLDGHPGCEARWFARVRFYGSIALL